MAAFDAHLVDPAQHESWQMPSVRCGDCKHFVRDAINTHVGVGHCTVDAPRSRIKAVRPMTDGECEDFETTASATAEDFSGGDDLAG